MQMTDKTEIDALFDRPLLSLLMEARQVHCQHFDPLKIELCTLLNIKTGGCPEDCAYCPQSAHYKVAITKEKLMDVEDVIEKAKHAKALGAKRFCMGAAWRNPPEKDFPKTLQIIQAVKALGLETCITLGTLTTAHAKALKQAGLDYYNHNLDSSPAFYKTIISTHTYQDRLDTLKKVHEAGIHMCCGGILGMGETREDRVEFLWQLYCLPAPLKSIPLNRLIAIQGTPLENAPALDNFDFIRMIAVTRILFPQARIRFAAGREDVSDEMQTLCFFAGVNSIFYGDVLLTKKNASPDKDNALLSKLHLVGSVAHDGF